MEGSTHRRRRRAGEPLLRKPPLPAAGRRPRRVPPAWDDARRRAESHLFWPPSPTATTAASSSPAAARCRPRTMRCAGRTRDVVGIDVSATSIAFTQELKRKYALDNLEVRQLAVERAAELGQTFEHVVCTGVLHHLADPDAGLRALRDVLAPAGAMHVMVYAPYGRAGVYMLQEYCRRLGIGHTDAEIRDLAASAQGASAGSSARAAAAQLARFRDSAGLADALLHPARPRVLRPAADGLPRSRRIGVRALDAPSAVPAVVRRARDRAASAKLIELPRGRAIRRDRTVSRHDGPSQRRRLQERRLAQNASVDFDGDAWLRYVPFACPTRSPCANGYRRERRRC